MLTLVSKAKELGNSNGYTACVVGRLMSVFAHERFLNFHGQLIARLSRDHAVYEEEKRGRSWLLAVLSPLLFNGPRFHLKTLDEIWVDHIINYQCWARLIRRLQDEWQLISITSTVMVTVNVGFLAIQSVDRAGDTRSTAQLTGYLSAVLSIASIIAGLILSRQHRALKQNEATIAQAYLWSKHSERWGLEVLAIMYSLPYALLMWATCAFCVALTCQYFAFNPSIDTASVAGRLGVGLAWLFVLVLTAWVVLENWEGTEGPSVREHVVDFVDHARERAAGAMAFVRDRLRGRYEQHSLLPLHRSA